MVSGLFTVTGFCDIGAELLEAKGQSVVTVT
jgi:hypothetical protein